MPEVSGTHFERRASTHMARSGRVPAWIIQCQVGIPRISSAAFIVIVPVREKPRESTSMDTVRCLLLGFGSCWLASKIAVHRTGASTFISLTVNVEVLIL